MCLAKLGDSLQHAISHEPRISFFATTGYLLVHRRVHIVYYVVEFKTMNKHKQLFNSKVRSSLTQDNVVQQLNVVDDSCESTLVLKRA